MYSNFSNNQFNLKSNQSIQTSNIRYLFISVLSMLSNHIQRDQKLTLNQLCDAMKKEKDLFKNFSQIDLERLVVKLLLMEILEEFFHTTAYRYIGYLILGYYYSIFSPL